MDVSLRRIEGFLHSCVPRVNKQIVKHEQDSLYFLRDRAVKLLSVPVVQLATPPRSSARKREEGTDKPAAVFVITCPQDKHTTMATSTSTSASHKKTYLCAPPHRDDWDELTEAVLRGLGPRANTGTCRSDGRLCAPRVSFPLRRQDLTSLFLCMSFQKYPRPWIAS